MAEHKYLGQDIKKLGFGLMRLPTLDGANEVDIAQTCEMADIFLERGFKYFDTAYGYLNGESEKAVKKVLIERYDRESFYLATKLPVWDGADTAEEARQMTVTSLERTGAGYFDFYLLHNLGPGRTQKFEDFKIWDYVRELKEKGLIKHYGFSMHDTPEALDKVLTEHPDAEFVQLQINWADWDAPMYRARELYETAWLKHGKPVIIMEPVKGGMLANPHSSVKEVFDGASPEAEPKPSYSSWAIRFAASNPGIITVLSGMSNVAQMLDNTSYMQDFKPLTNSEQEAVVKAREALSKVPQVPCTNCKYCVPNCPKEIPIPDIFDCLNRAIVFKDTESAKFWYNGMVCTEVKASDCVACGNCERVCPQKIKIIETLREAAAKFE